MDGNPDLRRLINTLAVREVEDSSFIRYIGRRDAFLADLYDEMGT